MGKMVSSRATPRLAAVVLLVSWMPWAAALGSPGRPLAEALTELQRVGVPLVFSDAVVRPEMVVTAEPEEGSPRERVEVLLAPFGLGVVEGPDGLLVVVELARPVPGALGTLSGRVVVDGSGPPPAILVVTLIGAGVEAVPDEGGRFRFNEVPAGRWAVDVAGSGIVARRVEVEVVAGAESLLEIEVLPLKVFLSEVVVTPSHFRLLERHPESRQFLSRDEVARLPHAADDLLRAVQRLPGAASSDTSARFNLRGGANDEVLVLLDGVALYDPFHLKDFQSVFSALDSEAVSGVDYLTGGFPVEYGDRMSGVVDISTEDFHESPRTSLSLSTLNARLLSGGGFNAGRGQWLVVGRVWYPASVLDAVGATAEEILADYSDVLAKVQHRVGGRSTVSAHLLLGTDNLGFEAQDAEELERVSVEDRTGQAWLGLETDWTGSVHSRTVLYGGSMDRERRGGVFDLLEGTVEVSDERGFWALGLKQDWRLELDDEVVVKWGFDVEKQRASYDYLRIEHPPEDEEEEVEAPVVVDLEPENDRYSVHAAARVRLGSRLVGEAGLRWDSQSNTDDHQLSPRLNLLWEVAPRTTVRAAWGRFYQSQWLNELEVADGNTRFYPAQLAEHWLASVEHLLPRQVALRLDVYHKDLESLRPRYENLFNPLELYPESTDDRVRIAPERGRAEGVEVTVRQRTAGAWSWWATAAWSRAEDRLEGRWVKRSWDQPFAANLGLSLSLPHHWSLSLAGVYHIGWPTTPASGELEENDDGELEPVLVVGERNSARLDDYLRFDLRAAKRWSTGVGELELLLDVVNLTNRENPCCVDDYTLVVEEDGTVRAVADTRSWVLMVPTLGVRWSF